MGKSMIPGWGARQKARAFRPMKNLSPAFNPNTMSAAPYYQGGYTKNNTKRQRVEGSSGNWIGRTVRPPNSMEVTFNYRDQATTSLATITTGTVVDGSPYFVKFTTMNCNSLCVHDQAAGTTAEPFPMLTEYAAIWNRALVMKVMYKVRLMMMILTPEGHLHCCKWQHQTLQCLHSISTWRCQHARQWHSISVFRLLHQRDTEYLVPMGQCRQQWRQRSVGQK